MKCMNTPHGVIIYVYANLGSFLLSYFGYVIDFVIAFERFEWNYVSQFS